jgi:hypothetical protein
LRWSLATILAYPHVELARVWYDVIGVVSGDKANGSDKHRGYGYEGDHRSGVDGPSSRWRRDAQRWRNRCCPEHSKRRHETSCNDLRGTRGHDEETRVALIEPVTVSHV